MISRSQLLTRKRDIYSALRLLRQDRRDGLLDEQAYRVAVERYEMEAAQILEQLDTLPDGGDRLHPPGPRPSWGTSRAVLIGAAAMAVAAIGLFLVTGLAPRTGTGTGTAGSSVPSLPLPPAVRAAEGNLARNPGSVSALLGVGNAYLQNGNATAADRSYQVAMRVAPRDPEPPTLHAMLLDSTGKPRQAAAVLLQVERAHPAYARAWLLDGLIAGRTRAGYGRAIADWRRFLALDPHAPVAAQVRGWLAAVAKAQRKAG